MPLQALQIGNDYVGSRYTPLPPNAKKTGRDVVPFDLNETPALKDLVVADHVWSQKIGKYEYECIPQAIVQAQLDTFDKKLNAYMPMLEQHIERRIAFFFQQLIVCYKTGLHFEIGGTGDQQGGATSLYILNQQGQKQKVLDRQAAHSSTIPSLIAYDKAQWDYHRQHNTPKPQGFLFLNHSETFRNSNATMEMMTEINQTDSAIDGKEASNLLRTKALAILNRASKGEIDPEEGLFLFMQEAQGVIAGKRMQRTIKNETKTILSHFHRVIQETKTNLETNPATFDRLIGVAASNLRGNQTLFKKACEIRYEAIQKSQMGQSKLIERINTVSTQVLQQCAGRRTDHFAYAFRAVLIESMPTQETKRSVETLYAYPHEDALFGLRRTTNRLNGLARTEQLIRTNALPLIRNLATELKLELYRLQREEILRRGEITRTLRNAHGWTQPTLANKIKASYPAFAASQPTISRIENNIKLIDPTYATGLSRVMQVDPGLFMPMFYYNERR
ncbi:MAG: hypothetical protein K940chlam9_00479 [Chlamydiae bacterium]|nr:hypothetical protein [Chlamydiota bacterium]